MISAALSYITLWGIFILLHFLFYRTYFSGRVRAKRRYHMLKLVEFLVVIFSFDPIGDLLPFLPASLQSWWTGGVLLWFPLVISKYLFYRKYGKLL